jgi:hypothetical protein
VVLGWLSHDLGDSTTARAYCLDAWEHGWQAEHGEICAWAMDAGATIALYSGHPDAARDAALKGLSQAPAGTPAAIRVSCQLTRAEARLGRADAFHEQLLTTRRMPDHLDVNDNGLFSVDAGRVSSYAATSSIWLGEHAQGAVHAREALDFYGQCAAAQRSPTREAIARLDQALALTKLGRVDEAETAALTALASGRVTGAVLTRAGDLDAALRSQSPSAPFAADFHQRYRALREQYRSIDLTAMSA